MQLKQYIKLSQQLKMTPQLQQAIKLLQLSRVELEEHVRDEMQNPTVRKQPIPKDFVMMALKSSASPKTYRSQQSMV